MKKMNKKGFTLIELLAVIIILGVLMIIAIPSVTSYIQNSRKNAFVDSAVAYIDAVRTKVNDGKTLQFFSTGVTYMVPVGHEDGKSCVALESGGKSPFNDSWKFAYVAVTYTGDSYNYSFIGEDGSGQGLELKTADQLSKDGGSLLYSDSKTYSEKLQARYTPGSSVTGNVVATTGTPGTGEVAFEQGEAAALGITDGKAIYIYAPTCQY